jgi:ribosomal protein L7Ae-like RNA K-turn-binding protein
MKTRSKRSKTEKKLVLDDAIGTLIGFGLKSRQIVTGFEGVRRALVRNTIAMLLIDSEISEHTKEKIMQLAKQQNIPLYLALPDKSGRRLFDIAGYKVLGLKHSGLVQGLKSKLKQEN